MNVTVYLSLALVAGFGAMAPALARRLPPAVGSWLLTGGAVGATVAASAALLLLSLPLIAQLPLVARLGGWSPSILELDDPVHTPIAVAALAALALAVLRAARCGVGQRRVAAHSRQFSATLPRDQELVVVDEQSPYALAVPGRPGHIVASSAMLRSLDGRQRRALLAHERAHLRHRHDLHRRVVEICAAACPALAGLPAASRLACERWADETAAAATDRHSVASAIAVAASAPARLPRPVLAIAADAVTLRVHALRGPRPRLRPWLIAVPVLVLATVAACEANALLELHTLFEHAQAAR